MNLQKKALSIVAGILFGIFTINIGVLVPTSYSRYKEAILAKTTAVGEGTQKELAKVLSLGVPIDSLEGVGDKLREVMARDEAAGYAMVMDPAGKILFHSDDRMKGKELNDAVARNALASDKVLVQRTDSFYDLSFPLLNAEGKKAGVLRIGVLSKAINAQLYTLILWSLAVSSLCFLLSLVLVYLFISRSIISPITTMQKAAERIASGDLASVIDVKGEDEMARLGGAINGMAFNLKDMISKIQNITNSIASVTSKISASSGNILSAADVQKKAIEETSVAIAEMNESTKSVAMSAESLSDSSLNTSSAIMQMAKSIEKVAESSQVFDESTQETASSVEEMVANIKQIAESLENLSASSEEVASSVAEVNATIREIEGHADKSVGLAEKVMFEASDRGIGAASAALAGMQNIRTSVRALSDVINVLGKRSGDIGTILTVIDDVADQTNLLALNAAILAAQAGEQGKAFAVVADEIKSLAERTSVSTREIAELITSVQDETRSSVEMAAGGIVAVEEGLKLVKDVNDALKGIVDSSQVSTEMSKAIQRATSEESHVIRQITESIKEMSKQVENISRALQEQNRGSRFIIEATDKMKDMSRHVKDATAQQSDGSRQISGAIDNVARQAEQIAGATGSQNQRSGEVVESMGKIQSTTGNLINSSNQMNAAIIALMEEAKNLLRELEKFTVSSET